MLVPLLPPWLCTVSLNSGAGSVFCFSTTGTECFLAQMRAQKGELLERLSSARNFSNVDDEENYSAACKAVRQVGSSSQPWRLYPFCRWAPRSLSSKGRAAGSSGNPHAPHGKYGYLLWARLQPSPFLFPQANSRLSFHLPGKVASY